MAEVVNKSALFSRLPPAPTLAPEPAKAKVIVLDDDPTGTQTVHGIPVLTTWSVDALAAELIDPAPCAYLLTNTRAFPRTEACRINREIGGQLRVAAAATGRPFRVISRGDSTLRGHFPAETDALAAGLGAAFHATLVIPAFFAGGRYTIGDVHYVAQGEDLVPVGETEFAHDPEFGFRASDLRAWVEEKTAGAHPAATVRSVSLELLRLGGAEAARDELLSIPAGGIAIVNAAAPGDLAVLTHAIARAEERGRRFLFRTAADFVPAYAGISRRPLLEAREMRSAEPGAGGLIVAGSYVGRTSSQLRELVARHPSMVSVEVEVAKLIDAASRESEVRRAHDGVAAALRGGRDVVLFTSRALAQGASAEEFGRIGQRVMAALVDIVRTLEVRPSWIVAKGGITSSDLATRALGIRRAIVLGQALPGLPVWAPGPESKWPQLPYIVFPGNVGGPDALAELVRRLHASA
ncbi:MAG TPA: four-carbon acid sugar kinase family protein [Lacunisphaera sp.]|nr:four-carbon acid sugar kinase family protein [Lacunisphaera sp.]